jgi:serine protease AprX
MPKKKPRSTGRPEPGKPFDPLVLDKTVIAIPLLEQIRQEDEGRADRVIYNVIVDLNLEYPAGRDGARDWVIANVKNAKEAAEKKGSLLPGPQDVDQEKSRQTNQYLFAALEGRVIQELVRLDEKAASGLAGQRRSAPAAEIGPTIPKISYRIWPHVRNKRSLERQRNGRPLGLSRCWRSIAKTARRL